MGKASRRKLERRAAVTELVEQAWAGDGDALTIVEAWPQLQPWARDAAADHLAARKRVLAYKAAGTPYGDHARGYQRWAEQQGYPPRRRGQIPDWELSGAFDAASAAVREQMERNQETARE